MEKYRKKGDTKYRTNQLGRRLFEPVSRNEVLKHQGRWIPHRKRVYHLWFHFLRLCELDPDRKVDWRKYRGWGGSNEVLGTKFDDWWKNHWKELFSTPERLQTPKFITNRRISDHDSLRYQYLVMEYSHDYPEHGTYELSMMIQERESRLRHPVSSFTEHEGTFDGGGIDKRTVQRRFSGYRTKGRKIMDNVCRGKFP